MKVKVRFGVSSVLVVKVKPGLSAPKSVKVKAVLKVKVGISTYNVNVATVLLNRHYSFPFQHGSAHAMNGDIPDKVRRVSSVPATLVDSSAVESLVHTGSLSQLPAAVSRESSRHKTSTHRQERRWKLTPSPPPLHTRGGGGSGDGGETQPRISTVHHSADDQYMQCTPARELKPLKTNSMRFADGGSDGLAETREGGSAAPKALSRTKHKRFGATFHLLQKKIGTDNMFTIQATRDFYAHSPSNRENLVHVILPAVVMLLPMMLPFADYRKGIYVNWAFKKCV